MRDISTTTLAWRRTTKASRARAYLKHPPFFLTRFLFVACFLLVVCLSGQSAAQEQPGVGGFVAFQKAFAIALKGQGTEIAPSGPVWLQPEVLPGKEACTTCHLGLEDNRFLYARLPYRRHSGHYLQDHAAKRFGCTVCHGGVGSGLTFAAAGHPRPEDATRRRQWERYYEWRPPGAEGMVPLERIAGRCTLCHSAAETPDGAEPYQTSRALVAEKRCTACHVFRDESMKNVHRAVHLDHLGSKVGSSWLVAYLKAPHVFRPGTAMPAYEFSDEEVQALSAYLLSRQDPNIGWENGDPSTDVTAVKRGLQVIEERHCQTCHDVPGIDESGFIKQRKVGPALSGAGEKLNPEWIRKWLTNPDAVRPGAGMPHFRFQEGEIDEITAFLSSLRAAKAWPTPFSASSSPDSDRATQIATKYQCAACHAIAGLALDPPPRSDQTRQGPELLARLSPPQTSVEHLEGPQGIFHRSSEAPRLFAPGEAADPLLTFLAAQADLPIAKVFKRPAPQHPPAFKPTGPAGKLVEELRCLSCHTIRGTGGDIGPDLTYAGSKLQRDWLVGFLQSPVAIRPMNRARMPVLGLTAKEAETLADWIVSELTTSEVDQNPPDLDLAFSFVGAAKVKSPYGCITCHRIGEEGGAVGPELTHVGSRLTAKWIYHWIKNPPRWIRGVRMPKFDMNEEDLLAITRFLSEQK